MNQFEVSEIAVYWNPAFPSWHGREVTVIGKVTMFGSWYDVQARNGITGLAAPEELRKRRPPPDWLALAGAKELEQVG